MRVALVSFNAQSGDAIGNLVAEKLVFFLERGADVRVFVQSDRRLHAAVRPHCRVVAGNENRGENWRFLSSADLVVVEYGQYYDLLAWLPLLGGGKGRVLFDYHGVTPPEMWSLHNREAIDAGVRQRGLVWAADAALVHSEFTGQELTNATGFPPDRCTSLAHPVDTNQFWPGSPGRSLADRLGLAEASVLLFVGRLAPNKCIPVLIEAVAELRDLTPPVHAVVIGDGEDIYQAEARRCRQRAAELKVSDRVHLLGQVSDAQLRDAYQSAQVFVMPSRHEGFCIPVVEAMACGLPVLAARNTALPETVRGAGLTFRPDDAQDLARQVRRLLQGEKGKKDNPNETTGRWSGAAAGGGKERLEDRPRLRVAVVSFRHGTDFAGGAETSLRRIAQCLHQAGHQAEIFTTCTREESAWSNQLPEGTISTAGVPVHRFRLDAHDRARHLESVRAILQAERPVPAAVEQEYLRHSLHSARLLEALRQRGDEFDAFIAGPYLFGLTLDVARAFPKKTLVLGCFHEEPFASLPAWQEYERTAGILYHSAEEQLLAESRLGINHPGGTCIGALVEEARTGKTDKDSHADFQGQRYLVYCGRYSAQKGVPVLLDYAERYAALHPDRYCFVFLGQGEVSIPKQPWVRDLGLVDEPAKARLLAGAAALVQLSRYESLSYVALEAWAQGTPVIADGRCQVLAGHLQRCGGGHSVDCFEDFVRVLDDLWQAPEKWQGLGRQGQEYVQKNYGSAEDFTARIVDAIRQIQVPLAERMRCRGLERAGECSRTVWRERFAGLVEDLLDAGPRLYREEVEVKPRSASRTAAADSGTLYTPVRVINRGSHVIAAQGPGRFVLRYRMFDEKGQPCGGWSAGVDLPGLVMPGRAVAAALPVMVPAVPGNYEVGFRAERWDAKETEPRDEGCRTRVRLMVHGSQTGATESCCAPLLEIVQSSLVAAQGCQQLPVEYMDVSEGWLARWKRLLKRKLLNNFKHAYVDVLSRQQSAFNQFVLRALEELAECCATLDHKGRSEETADAKGYARGPEPLLEDVVQELAATQLRCEALEERLAQIEDQIKQSG